VTAFFINCINDIKIGMKSSVLKFADDTKVYGNVLTSPGKLDKA